MSWIVHHTNPSWEGQYFEAAEVEFFATWDEIRTIGGDVTRTDFPRVRLESVIVRRATSDEPVGTRSHVWLEHGTYTITWRPGGNA